MKLKGQRENGSLRRGAPRDNIYANKRTDKSFSRAQRAIKRTEKYRNRFYLFALAREPCVRELPTTAKSARALSIVQR